MIRTLPDSLHIFIKINRTALCSFIFLLASQFAFSQSGKVFHDYNNNGIANTGEPGVQGIIIKSYTAANTLLASATSDGNGSYSLSPAASAGQPVRIEFEIPASKNFFKPSASGSAYGSNVQFVTGNATAVNFAVLNPAKFTEGNPFIAVPLNVKGEQITGANKNEDVLLNINNAWGASTPVASSTSTIADWRTPSAPIGLAKAKEVGTTYGVAYSKKRKTVYTSAFYRQFCGFGPGGPGAIYSVPVDPVAGTRTAAPSLFADVATMTTVMSDIHGTDLTTLAHSDTRLAPTTKNSLGDLEISDDETKLYTVNLTSREVIAINAITGTMINKWVVPTTGLMTSAGLADPNDIRPFGLGYKDGELYVGAVCTGESSVVYNGTATSAKGNRDLLHAFVWKLNETTGVFTLVFDYRLRNSSYRWLSWQSSWANGVRVINPTDDWANCPQAILTDIEFYGNDMTLSFRDRQGDLWGYEIMDPVTGRFAYGTIQGDIVGAAYNAATSTYTLESNGNIGSRVGTGAYAASGSTEFEFYRGDGATNYTNGHVENAMGGIAQYGAYPLIFSTMAVSDMFNTHIISCGGLGWMDNENGNAAKAYIAYESKSGLGTMGKANGLGDVCVLGAETQMEIGNRVWNDINGNGMQDAGEPGIAGIKINLYDLLGIILFATTTTDANGNWYFNRSNVADGAAAAGIQPGIQPNYQYKIRIDPTQFSMQGLGILSTYFLTIPHQTGASFQPNFADSDAMLTVGGLAEISITTGANGESNHNLDIGLNHVSSALSATLAELRADNTDNKTILNWNVLTGAGYQSFTVQRSFDQKTFSNITVVNAVDNAGSYSFTDNEIFSGTAYYRIRVNESEGIGFYSNMVTGSRKNSYAALHLYPNPAKGKLHIEIPAEWNSNTVRMELFSNSGQLTMQQTIAAKQTAASISTAALPDGIYFVRFSNTNGILDTKKIVVKK